MEKVRRVLFAKFFGKDESKLHYYMRPWGSIGYVTIRSKMKSKWKEKSIRCILVGYASNHSRDTYRMYNPKTRSIIQTRDVQWANWNRIDPKQKMDVFGKSETKSGANNDKVHDDADDIHADDVKSNNQHSEDSDDDANGANGEVDLHENDMQNDDAYDIGMHDDNMHDNNEMLEVGRIDRDEVQLPNNANGEAEAAQQPNAMPMRMHGINTRSKGEPPALQTMHMTPQLQSEMQKLNFDVQIVSDEANLALNYCATAIMPDPGEPKTFTEAMNCEDADKWKPAAASEVMNFINRNVWIKVARDEAIKAGRKPIPVKWIFKKKNDQDGSIRFKARIVVRGFMQIPGVDYTEHYSPVANDTTIRVLIAHTLHKVPIGWTCEVFDVEAAFLEADLAHPLYVEWPEGMTELGFLSEDEIKSTCIRLNKSMYGTVDAPIQMDENVIILSDQIDGITTKQVRSMHVHQET